MHIIHIKLIGIRLRREFLSMFLVIIVVLIAIFYNVILMRKIDFLDFFLQFVIILLMIAVGPGYYW